MSAGFAFDNGLAEAVDTLIQRGVVQLLEPLRYVDEDDPPATNRGPYLRTLEAIPQMPELEFMERQRTEYMRRMPGILVYVGGGERTRNAVSGNRAWFTRQLMFIIFSGVAPDAVDGRLDETSKVPTSTLDDPGVRVIRQHAYERLENKFLPTLSTTAHQAIRVQNYLELETGPDWTSWGMLAEFVLDEAACAADTRTAPMLDAIRTKHDLNNKGILAQQKTEVI